LIVFFFLGHEVAVEARPIQHTDFSTSLGVIKKKKKIVFQVWQLATVTTTSNSLL